MTKKQVQKKSLTWKPLFPHYSRITHKGLKSCLLLDGVMEKIWRTLSTDHIRDYKLWCFQKKIEWNEKCLKVFKQFTQCILCDLLSFLNQSHQNVYCINFCCISQTSYSSDIITKAWLDVMLFCNFIWVFNFYSFHSFLATLLSLLTLAMCQLSGHFVYFEPWKQLP